MASGNSKPLPEDREQIAQFMRETLQQGANPQPALAALACLGASTGVACLDEDSDETFEMTTSQCRPALL